MKLSPDIESALNEAWNRDVAENSVERWLKLCDTEGWGKTPGDMRTLVRLFGASWYFTRFIFVNGREVAELIDDELPSDTSTTAWLKIFEEVLELKEQEAQLDRLRVYKNRAMLQILIACLKQVLNQEQTEHALTCLADATVRIITQLFQLTPEHTEHPVTLLGMGRMAGYEMTFGSDLDLIFLYSGESSDIDAGTERQIRLLLRNIAVQTSSGSLYDVDMRLRPHGNAGVLITPFRSFLDYHAENRDIWERQTMTRCRPVANINNEVESLMRDINDHVYGEYDIEFLRSEITSMRKRVEKELGRPAGKYEVKRGRGGIMDIDFITHFFQLAYGRKHKELCTGSTREALRAIAARGMMDGSTCKRLLSSYDFLKQVEMSLRLFDMKPVSTFYYDAEANGVLARAMGFGEEGPQAFMEYYRSVTDGVREIFDSVMAES